MSHWQISFRVAGPQSEALGDHLTDLGAIATTFENAGPDSFYEVSYPQIPDWQEITVTGLFPVTTNPTLVVQKIREQFGGGAICDVSALDDQDWERSWLSAYRPERLGRDLWVCPSWLTPPDPDAINLVIDPGLAFGTGTHPTTAMCLGWLDRNKPSGKHVIDYGCGSGILAIASLALGATHAWGTDVDPRALTASEVNAARNQVSDRFTACPPDDLPPGLQVDLVLANILANVLVEFRGALLALLNERGIIVLTGILPHQSGEVIEAFGRGLRFEQSVNDEWSMLVGYKS